jgi:hypothetical protein
VEIPGVLMPSRSVLGGVELILSKQDTLSFPAGTSSRSSRIVLAIFAVKSFSGNLRRIDRERREEKPQSPRSKTEPQRQM